jgi:hypothetical protein
VPAVASRQNQFDPKISIGSEAEFSIFWTGLLLSEYVTIYHDLGLWAANKSLGL